MLITRVGKVYTEVSLVLIHLLAWWQSAEWLFDIGPCTDTEIRCFYREHFYSLSVSMRPPLSPQQKARDNRAAQRINKVQLSNDPLKRQQPLQQPLLPPGPYDPVTMEADMAFKDLQRPKESEQEQEWKLRQVSRVSACLSLTYHLPLNRNRERNQHHTPVANPRM